MVVFSFVFNKYCLDLKDLSCKLLVFLSIFNIHTCAEKNCKNFARALVHVKNKKNKYFLSH